MAFTLPFRFTATLIDEQNVEADCTTYGMADPAAAASSLLTTLSSWLTALDGVTSGRIVRAVCCLYPTLPALKGTPGSDSRVQETALLAFTGPSTPRRDSIAVPGLPDTLLNTDGTIVTATGPVHTFISLIESGGSSLEFTTSDFDGPVTFKDSAYSFRQYSDQLEPATFVLAE